MRKLIGFLIKHFFSSKPKHFLILLQNNNELRSTGGYITSVFDLELGKLKAKKRNLNVGTDLYQHDKVKAPAPIEEMLFDGHLDTWTFRDSNYSPNFHESATKAIEFYHMVYPRNPVCGLLMVNFSFVEELLRALGPLKLEEVIVDDRTLFETLSSASFDIDRKNLEALNTRKDSLGKIANRLILKALLRPWRWAFLWGLGNRAFRERSLQFYDGRHPAKDPFERGKHEDFLAVIENNYLGLKSNRYMKRDIMHDTVIFPEGGLRNTVRIKWRHLGIYNYPLSGDYKGHVRVYLPLEAKIKAESHFQVTEEGDFQVVGFKYKLPPSESLEIKLIYDLPASYCHSHYQFKFFKQSGVQNESLQKTLSLPITLEYSDEEALYKEQLMIRNCEDVRTDTHFSAHFKKSQKPPRIYSHHIVSRDQVLVKFNEMVDVKDAEIRIHEKGNPENDIKVKSAELLLNGKWILLKVEDFPETEEVFYTVLLKDIRNQNGIAIHPNPRTVSIVYRPRHFAYWRRELGDVLS